ncbi:penicillin-binding protein 2 [Nocardioides limicola]|uniref:penicillin-binding protein 2 n=1 Tax=Nocardioides limicola TaxID=2803368 RepID=UPI00193BA42D|nr:penicillin-binding protein 2 [Nocardioides sp. DJM-14]
MIRRRSRLRLVVVQALVLALFGTLLVRLWDVQVNTGEQYAALAASQSVREIVVQPERGLIVDAMGRPLVANRTAWVVSIDRNVLRRMHEVDRVELIRRAARTVGLRPARVQAKLLDCGHPDAVRGQCWNGSPHQPVPIATDVDRAVALQILEESEDFPAVIAERTSVRDYPSPYDINAAHLLGYLSPITESELDQAREDVDRSVNGASVVGRAGIERAYDAHLRGMPGYQRVAVDAMGRVLGDDSLIEAEPGMTLVTSLDAKVQSVVERELRETIEAARQTRDRVSGRNFVADAGAVVVMEVKTGRIVAMASEPTYDPGVWVGGISAAELDRLYSADAGTPLLSRATQGQMAPGSTWKPFMTAGALTNGYPQDARLACSSSFRVGNRSFRNYESGAYGTIGFARALEVSCNTFFYRLGYDYWRRLGSDVADQGARDPLVEVAQDFGFGSLTGIDIHGEASGRIADRTWKRAYYEQMKDHYCEVAGKGRAQAGSDFQYRFAVEFCAEGYAYRAGDAVNFSIGQGDTMVTPLQLAVGYAAIANGGTLWEPRVGKAVVDHDGNVVKRIKPQAKGTVGIPKRHLRFIDESLKGVSTRGTMSWRLGGFPLDQVPLRAKTGSAEVNGKQSTSWLATYTDDYVVVMTVSQGGTGSGTSGPAVRRIWEALYGVEGDQADRSRAAIPGVVAPARLPTFGEDGSIMPPTRRGR